MERRRERKRERQSPTCLGVLGLLGAARIVSVSMVSLVPFLPSPPLLSPYSFLFAFFAPDPSSSSSSSFRAAGVCGTLLSDDDCLLSPFALACVVVTLLLSVGGETALKVLWALLPRRLFTCRWIGIVLIGREGKRRCLVYIPYISV